MVRACPSLHYGERDQGDEVDVEELGVGHNGADPVEQRAGHSHDYRIKLNEFE